MIIELIKNIIIIICIAWTFLSGLLLILLNTKPFKRSFSKAIATFVSEELTKFVYGEKNNE